VLDSAEFRFTVFGKYFRNGLVCRVLYSFVEVYVNPANLPGQKARDSGFAAAHETRQAHKGASARIIRHRFIFCGGSAANQSRFRMLIVPSKEVSSTLARP
jgi:hypothetical protein